MVIYTDICLTDNVRQMSGSFIGNTDISLYFCNKKSEDMKRLLLCSLLAFAINAIAQDAEKDVSLNEVTVQGARKVQKVDGQWIYPTKQQIENSPNGNSLCHTFGLMRL